MKSQAGGGEEGSHSAAEEVFECHPSDRIAPDSVAFSPDDKLISYLVTPESKLGTQVFAFDLEKKEQRLLLTLPDDEVEEAEEDNLSGDETKRRKRLGERGHGFARYGWAKGACGPTLMVPRPGGIYIQDEQTAELRLRVPNTASSPVSEVKLSPDGSSIAFVRDDEIYVIPTMDGEEIQITSGARGTGKTNGTAEDVEMGETEKRPGFWWSIDSSQIAFAEVDAAGVPSSPTGDEGENGNDGDANVVDTSALKRNVFVRLGIVPASGGEVSWVQLLIGGAEHDDEKHLVKVMWLSDGFLVAEVQNHDISKMKLLKFNPSTRKRQILLEEKGNNAKHSDCFTPLKTGGFIWASTRSGLRHLYLYDAAGLCLGPLTEGSCAVKKVLAVDENAGLVYFMGASTPLETHLYRTLIFPDYKFPVGIPKQLTSGEGQHIVVIDHQKQKFVDMLMEDPRRVYIRSLTNSRLAELLGFKSPQTSDDLSSQTPEQLSEAVEPEQLSEAVESSEEDPQKAAVEELQRAVAVLLKYSSNVFDGLCRQCIPILEKRLARLALLDTTAEIPMDYSLTEDDTVEHSEAEDQPPPIPEPAETLVRTSPQPETVNGNECVDVAVNHSETREETVSNTLSIVTAAETLVRDLPHSAAVNCSGIVDDDDTVSHSEVEDVTSSTDTAAGTLGTEKGKGNVDDNASSGETTLSDSHPETVGRQEKPRLWSEEQSSGSEVDEELSPRFEDPRAGILGPFPKATDTRVPSTAAVESKTAPDSDRPLSFRSHIAVSNYAWANVTLPSPRRVGDEETVASSNPETSHDKRNGSRAQDVQLPSPVVKPSRLEREERRMQSLVRKKDFECWERIRGRMVNVVEGLELHQKVFNNIEQQKLIEMVYKYQEMGRNGLLRDRTYSEPRKWMPGKGRVTIQFGCCYNYAVDRNGNPPGIMYDDLVDPLPDLLKTTIRRLVRWGVLPEVCVPDSCIINIYDVGDCIPPHIDHHDFVRPFSTLSLLSECNILFGSRLSIVGEGQFDGPLSIPLPVGSVLVLKGNGADVAKHAVPGVPTRRISITFRKMDPLRTPRGYELPQDLRGVRAAPQLRDRERKFSQVTV